MNEIDASSSSRPFGRFERSLAWRYIRARRENGGASLISVISFLGIMLAVTALIVTMSLMNGFRATLTNTLIGGQGHIFVGTGALSEEEALALADELSTLDGLKSVSPILEGQVLLDAAGRQSGAVVRGVRPEDLTTYPALKQEDVEGFGDGRNGGDTIIIGVAIANLLNVSVGSRVTLLGAEGAATPFGRPPRRKEYVVGGLLKTGNFELDSLYVFMPFEQAQLFFGQKEKVQFLDVRLDDYEAIAEGRAAINEATGNRFFMDDWQRRNGSYLGALETESGVMRLIMLILITITSLNIITGVVMLVKNKAGDIAILRTIGASRASMMRVFIMIGGLLGLAGALIGLVLGLTIVINIDAVEWFLDTITGRPIFPPDVYGLDGLPARLDIGEALFTTGWAMVMSMLVTIWPAWLAARTDPVEALRFE